MLFQKWKYYLLYLRISSASQLFLERGFSPSEWLHIRWSYWTEVPLIGSKEQAVFFSFSPDGRQAETSVVHTDGLEESMLQAESSLCGAAWEITCLTAHSSDSAWTIASAELSCVLDEHLINREGLQLYIVSYQQNILWLELKASVGIPNCKQ